MWSRTLLAITFLVVGAACSGAGEPVDTPPERRSASRGTERRSDPAPRAVRKSRPTRVDPRQRGFEVGFGEFAISLEARAIRPGPVTFVVHNGGRLVHGFELEAEDEGSNSGPGGGDGFEIESATFDAGETIRITTNLAPGLYEIECYIGDHEDRGMRALLEVRDDAPLIRHASESPDRVAIEGFKFEPKRITVATGTTVTWTNHDPSDHTVTAEDQSFSSEPFGAGATFKYRFDRPGTYAYLCAIHPAMKAIVRVTP